MIVNDTLYTTQTYLELVTGKTFFIQGDDDVEFINKILRQENVTANSCPFTDVQSINNKLKGYVLVDCMIYDEDAREYIHKMMWYEVPEKQIFYHVTEYGYYNGTINSTIIRRLHCTLDDARLGIVLLANDKATKEGGSIEYTNDGDCALIHFQNKITYRFTLTKQESR